MNVIKTYIKLAPESPGVYLMLGTHQEVLYVGKAKNLKKRISQYLRPFSDRIFHLLTQVTKLDFFVTEGEAQALLLEAEMIKASDPKYNILLKDDKSYPYIFIDKQHDYPRITKYRGVRNASCYGPFVSAMQIKNIILTLQKTFLIRPCSNSFFANRQTPCLEYQLKRCSAPCVKKITVDQYKVLIQQTEAVLRGNIKSIQAQLLEEMQLASVDQQYEKAALYRDRLRSLQGIKVGRIGDITSDTDLIALYFEKNQACIGMAFARKNKSSGNYRYFINDIQDKSPQELIEYFLMQIYTSPPSNIYVNYLVSPEAEIALNARSTHKVNITYVDPLQHKDMAMVLESCTKALKQKLYKEGNLNECLVKLQTFFNLKKVPERIEVYDNSHTFGKQAVGVMIVVTPEGFNKQAYRCYNIKDSRSSDDYGMMQEILKRRLEKKNHLPDFILIDGGPGHLSVVQEILGDIPCAAIAKGIHRNAGREKFYLNDGRILTLPDNSPLLYFLQNIRDEAHRFAIKTHRNARGKAFVKSELDTVPGIGEKRKKALLAYFGSVDAIKRASIKSLTSVKSINKKIAQDILSYLNIG